MVSMLSKKWHNGTLSSDARSASFQMTQQPSWDPESAHPVSVLGDNTNNNNDADNNSTSNNNDKNDNNK